MAGMILYHVNATEAKELKKSPNKLSSLTRKNRMKVDVGEASFQIDLALSYILEKVDEPILAYVIGGGNLIGNDNYYIRCHPAKKVKEIAAALQKVIKNDFTEAYLAIGASPDDIDELGWTPFQALRDFYTEASKKRKAIIETIY
jgi:Domain of unknown function (DUF1877)